MTSLRALAWALCLPLVLLAGSAAPRASAQGASIAQPSPVPPPIELTTARKVVPLDNKARYWIDNVAQSTPEGLEKAGETLPWAPRVAGAGYRIDNKALWFSFDAINREGRWFVELGSSGIDRAQLFYRDAGGRWVTQEAGDSRPVSEWPLPGRVPTFELAPPSDVAVHYWLRIEHDRVDYASPIRIYEQATLVAERESEQFLLGGYFSLALLIAVISAANAIAFKDRNFGTYAVYVASLALGQLAYLGVGAQHVWDKWLRWNEMAGFLLPGLSAAAALWFTRTITEPGRFSRALDIGVWALIAAVLSALATDAVAPSRLTIGLVVILSSMSLAVIALQIALVWRRGSDPQIGLIALGFLPVLVMAIFPILKGLNLIPVSALTRYALSIGAAIEMPILFYALSLRVNQRRESQVRAAALGRTDTLTGLAHTRTFMPKLEDALQRCESLKHACALMGVKIANHEQIVAEYGRDTAERGLVVAASLLRKVAADVDLAARVGDHEFALLLEGPALPADVTNRAQQLVASGLRPSEALPPGVVLKFQVATALLPDRGLDAQGAMHFVADALNAMRSDARKLIRALNF